MRGGEKVESVPAYSQDLEDLNNEISQGIDLIQEQQLERESSTGDIETFPAEDKEPAQDTAGSSLETSLLAPSASGSARLKSLFRGEDGEPRDAAFVCLTNLTSTNLARQAVHHHTPWACVLDEPPRPKLVK